MIGKGAFLKKITSHFGWRSTNLGTKLDGSTPPSVFIGRANYPKVFVGPMLSTTHESSILDSPESWIPLGKTQDEIIDFRMNLIRGKEVVSVTELENNLVRKLTEIALAKTSVEAEAVFHYKPYGYSFSDEELPIGPSAKIDKFDITNSKWDHFMEKAYYDTDLIASEAVFDLYTNDVPFSSIQKALSVGAFGLKKSRKMVPTRNSITALDSTLSKKLFDEVKHYPFIEEFYVYEYSSLNNSYYVILIPGFWQFEWMEAFIRVNENHIFSDFEQFKPKTQYSEVGGCYYSSKFAVLEALNRMKKQSTAIILREAYEDYVPLGVFNVRENIRNALIQKPKIFENLRQSLTYVSSKLRLPISRFIEESSLLKELLKYQQTTL